MGKVELVCRLCHVKWLEHVIPLRLTRSVFAIYQQWRDEKANADKIKTLICWLL